ncbi:MAG: VOC family protein [Fimbriimonadales bacterium]
MSLVQETVHEGRIEAVQEMTNSSALTQLILDVASLDSSVRFYRGQLGLSVARTEEWEGHRLATIKAHGLDLLLLEQPNEDQIPPAMRGGGVVLNFQVSNLKKLTESLREQQVPFLRDLDNPAFGNRTLLIADPDGYAILLSEPVGHIQ